jgi:3-methyladenine DNA glycosylase AlkD
MGKRNDHLRALAIQQAEAIAQLDSKAARWIAKDALKELSHY